MNKDPIIQDWKEEYCKRFGLCKELSEKCQCGEELKFIEKVRNQALEEIREKIEIEFSKLGEELITDDRYLAGHKEGERYAYNNFLSIIDEKLK
jgi:hypothetical protein